MNCPKCNSNPCTCGEQYKDWTIKQLLDQINLLQQLLATRTAVEYPDWERARRFSELYGTKPEVIKPELTPQEAVKLMDEMLERWPKLIEMLKKV